MGTPVLASKLFPPARRPQLVDRDRLTSRLDAALRTGNVLTLVAAPAGFGKTTLVTDWLSRQLPQPLLGWVSLDEDDNDLPRLLAHLVAALDKAGLPVDTSFLDLLQTGPLAMALETLVNDVADACALSSDQHLLVLDDYHVLSAPEAHEAVGFLLDHLPDQVHLLLATRADPPLPVARLRSRGQLVEIRAADLRFTVDEAQTFLNQVMGLHLDRDDVRALETRTEGWAAGLQLAALSMRDRDDVTGFIDAFTGSHRFVVDYLIDEVLAGQPAPVRDFLLRTAVLDQLTGPLCDALTGRHDGARMLVELERANLFVVPLDDDRTTYRYHHLFSDVLRARVLAEHPADVPLMHRAASGWFESAGRLEDAVRHALAAGDHPRAARLVEVGLPEVRRTRQDGLLLRWLRSLPDDAIRASPVLNVFYAWSLMVAGDLDQVEARLDEASGALAAAAAAGRVPHTWAADTDELRTLPMTIAVYRASLAQARGDADGTVAYAQQALDLAGPTDHLVRGAGAGFLALAAWAAGDVPTALETFTEAANSVRAAEDLVDALSMTVVLADMWWTVGRPGRGRGLLEEALRGATSHGQPHPRATADLHVALAELDRELGDLPAAVAHLEAAEALGERAATTEGRFRWFSAMAGVRVAQGDHDGALELLDEAKARYLRGFFPDVRPLPAVRARVQIARGDLDAADQWARAHDVGTADEATYLREYDQLTLVRLLLARQRRAGTPLDDALPLLGRLHTDAEAGRAGSLLEIRVLQSLTHDAGGDRAQALAVLDQALSDAPEPDAYARLFLDEGGPMLALLDAATRDGREELQRHARRLLAAADRPHPAPTEPAVMPDPLSDRELEVLRLLDSELTGPEIARGLFVSLNTLRTHTKRIFTKLDVNSRAAAVRRGRERGLL